MSSKGALVVIGSGPGVGSATATYFAEQGFQHVVLLSRDASRLAEDAKTITSKAPNAKVDTLSIDMAASEETVNKVLNEVEAKLKAAHVPLEVVLYNAARVGPSNILDWEAKALEVDLKICAVNLYVTLQWAIPKLLETSKSSSHNPAFLTTSGGLYRDPFPFLFSLSTAKAAQHNLMHSFHKKYDPDVHIACVPVVGLIQDQAKVTTARAVAEQFWKLYQQPKGRQGQFSVEIVDPDYESGVEQFRKMVEGG